MAKLYLHIGTHKTATSAIQQYVYEHSEDLKSENIKVLRHSDLPSRSEFRKSEVVSSSLIDAYKTYFKTSLKNDKHKYFLCWEGFSGDPERFYKNNGVVLEMLSQALPKDIEVEISVAFRRQDEFVQSVFTQLRHQNEEIEFKDFLKLDYYEGLDWFKFANTIIQVFGKDIKLHVLPYEPALFKKRNLLQLLGAKLNIDSLSNVANLPQRNVGFSKNATNLFEQITPSLASEYQSKILRRSLQKVDNKGVGKEYNLFSYNEKLTFLKYYKESNAKLADQYWQKEFDLTNFSSPHKEVERDGGKATEELVIKELLQQVEDNNTKLRSNIFFRIINKLSR